MPIRHSPPSLRRLRTGWPAGALLWAGAAVAAPEAPPTAAGPDPIRIPIGDAVHVVRLDTLQRFGATPLPEICEGPPESETMQAFLLTLICDAEQGKTTENGSGAPRPGEAALMLAAERLDALKDRPATEREAPLRAVNGLILAGLRRGEGGLLESLASRFSDLGEEARDGTPFAIAGELLLARTAFCDAADWHCRAGAETASADEFVQAGRWHNDVDQLRRAGEMAERAERGEGPEPRQLDERGLFKARNAAGAAYSYAAAFAEPAERRPFMERSVAAYERALPSAEAQAPSFASARLWHNLGAAYVDRAALTRNLNDFERGVALYERAIPLFDPRDDRRALARARSNMGRARSRIATRTRDLAIHDRAVADQRAAIKGYEAASETFDAAFARYRLAQDLFDRAKTADGLARDLAASRAGDAALRRDVLIRIAVESREQALARIAHAVPVLERAGATQYLEWARELGAEIRAAEPKIEPKIESKTR
ncbi:hypothetical protein C0214_08525 [Methylobacterium sp. DM1]|nr:hypothetical protein C0214_08525 [Methylobacterium sp. DM1]